MSCCTLAWLSSSRATAISSLNGRPTHTTWRSSSRSFVSERCIQTSCLRALRTLAEHVPGSARRPGRDEQSRSHARHFTTRCRWAPHMACLPSGPPSAMVRPDTSGWRRRRAHVLGRFRDDSPIPERECFPRDAVPSDYRGLHDPPPGWWLRVLVRESHRDQEQFSPILNDSTRAGSTRAATSVRVLPVRPRRPRLHR